MSAATGLDRDVEDARRRRRANWFLGLVALLVVLAVAGAWAWHQRLYLMDDYRDGWNAGLGFSSQVATESQCAAGARPLYPDADWQGNWAQGPSGRSARAYLIGCRDATDGATYDPWHLRSKMSD